MQRERMLYNMHNETKECVLPAVVVVHHHHKRTHTHIANIIIPVVNARAVRNVSKYTTTTMPLSSSKFANGLVVGGFWVGFGRVSLWWRSTARFAYGEGRGWCVHTHCSIHKHLTQIVRSQRRCRRRLRHRCVQNVWRGADAICAGQMVNTLYTLCAFKRPSESMSNAMCSSTFISSVHMFVKHQHIISSRCLSRVCVHTISVRVYFGRNA